MELHKFSVVQVPLVEWRLMSAVVEELQQHNSIQKGLILGSIESGSRTNYEKNIGLSTGSFLLYGI